MRKIIFILLTIVVSITVIAQKKVKSTATTPIVKEVSNEASLISKVKFRSIGPFRGGRSAAVTGSYKNKTTFYFGGTGGGIFKTTDGGSN